MQWMPWQHAVERTVAGLGYDLVDAQSSAGGLLRVTIDHAAPEAGTGEPEKFITVDDCERVTRQLQHVLDVENCAYERLEVSSPGLDRPLRKAADYARFAGQQVEVTLKLPFQGRKKYSGELQARGADWRLVLAPAKPGKAGARAVAPVGEQALDFALDEVKEARLVPVVDFKGRRFAKAAPEGQAADAGTRAVDGVEGDRIQ